MPLTEIQRKVLSLIAHNRAEQSYVAGGAALNRAYPRLSDDIDIFNDRGLDLATIAKLDIDALIKAGLIVKRSENHYGMIIDAIASDGAGQTMIQWQDETPARFFAIMKDETFGMRLADADLAVNKVLAAAGRREARDMIDLVTLTTHYAPLGALVWAATAKTQMGPGQMLETIHRHAREFTADEIAAVRTTSAPFSRVSLLNTLETALSRAQRYIESAPDSMREHLFIAPDTKPIEATEAMIKRGQARALPLIEFGHVVPVVG